MLTRNRDSFSIRAIASNRSDCGEGPIWNSSKNIVTWVDIAGKKWHQTPIGSNESDSATTFTLPTVIGAIVERSRGGYFAAVEEGFGSISSNGEYKLEIEFLPKGERMNDAKADASGRWWVGSCDFNFVQGRGRLHVVDHDWKITTIETGVTLPNGLGWSPDNKSFYFIDSMQRLMWRYDYDTDSGNLSHRSVFVKFPEKGGLPDGLAIATDGSILVALCGGGQIDVYAPDGTLKEIIPLPVTLPTSCAFGGADGSTLIVTSAGGGVDLAKEPLAGLTMAIEGLGYSGKPSEVFGG
ncbi:MAG: SMP-30/gluconolactonase/LRE family protein [Actinomycetota bacterium]